MAGNVKYFKTTWRLLNLDGPKWVLQLIVLCLLQIIPIIGQMILLGYLYSWSNRTAWAMHSSPIKKGQNFSQVFKLGAILFVPFFCLSLVVAIINMLLSSVLAMIPVIGWIILMISPLALAFINVLILVALQRAAIYRKIEPGFQIAKILDMCGRDWNGLIRIFGINIILSIVGILVASFTIGSLITAFVTGIAVSGIDAANGAADPNVIADYFVSLILANPLPLLIGICISALIEIFGYYMIIGSIGVWTAQLYPECWGPSSEYVPITPGPLAPAPEAVVDNTADSNLEKALVEQTEQELETDKQSNQAEQGLEHSQPDLQKEAQSADEPDKDLSDKDVSNKEESDKEESNK